jgi:hypothetical protein
MVTNAEKSKQLDEHDEIKRDIGRELRKNRQQKRKLLKEITPSLEVDKSTIYRWEGGNFELCDLISYCLALDIPKATTWDLCFRAYPKQMCAVGQAYDATKKLSPPRQRFGTQADFYKEIGKLCKEQGRGKITFYHYSGAAIEELVGSLYRLEYDITIYTQDPDIPRLMGCQRQTDRIRAQLGTYSDNFRNSERLRIYQSSVPVTVRAANVDDQHIVLGWYIYELEDTLRLWGHDYQHRDLYAIWLDAGDKAFDDAKHFLELYEALIAPRLIFGRPSKSDAADLVTLNARIEKYKKMIMERD